MGWAGWGGVGLGWVGLGGVGLGWVGLLGELNHPNIVKLHGWYEKHTFYVALERCVDEGGG